MVKANVEIKGKEVQNDIEIKGSTFEIILELGLILMRIKENDDQVFFDILKSMEIINDEIDNGTDVNEIQDTFINSYLKTLKKGSK